MKRALAFGALALLVAAGLHCAKQEKSGFEDENEAGADAKAPPPPPGNFVEAGTLTPRGECEETTKQIFVFATDKALYRFDPEKLTFTRIGTVGCPTAAGSFSMAIDRRGIAYVEFTDGHIYMVDTTNGQCVPTTFKAGQTGFELFGMGFALNAEDPTQGETLYVAETGLASIDTKTFDLKFLGPITAGRTELTARGTDLFGFNVVNGVVSGLDKASGKTTVSYRTTAINAWAGFAFAHWGGDFWIFTGDERSQVTRYQPDIDKSTVVIQDTGMLIVGAGSSTCAPVKPR